MLCSLISPGSDVAVRPRRPRNHRIAGWRRAVTAIAVAAATLIPMAVTASPASAAVSNCSKGYNTANVAWGTCRSGSGSWSLTVQCYAWGANTVYGWGPRTLYSHCPGWSHITNIILRVDY